MVTVNKTWMLLLGINLSLTAAIVPGGLTDIQDATKEIQNVAEMVKKSLETELSQSFIIYEAIQYRSQVVAGTNYFIKVQVGGNKYIHLRIYQNWTGDVTLSSYQLNKKLEDPIEYF